MSKFMRIGLIAGWIILANAIYAAGNALASEGPCGDQCENYKGCSSPCSICFPNPVEQPGSCIAS